MSGHGRTQREAVLTVTDTARVVGDQGSTLMDQLCGVSLPQLLGLVVTPDLQEDRKQLMLSGVTR